MVCHRCQKPYMNPDITHLRATIGARFHLIDAYLCRACYVALAEWLRPQGSKDASGLRADVSQAPPPGA